MSENFSIGSYNCSTSNVYEVLKDFGLDDNTFKKIDKNSDKTITEDELVEFAESEEETENTDTDTKTSTSNSGESEDVEVQNLQNQKDRKIKEMYKLKAKIKRLENLQKQAEAEAVCYAKESEARNKADSIVSDYEGQISSINSQISSAVSQIVSLDSQIAQLKNSKALAAQYANAITNTSSVTNTSTSTNNTSGNIEVQEGSGANLASVTGDLSTCLDRVASSLGVDRQTAADYITTLCNTVGCGYFEPKVILSQIFSESGGDNSASSTPAYVGFGQMSAVAVEEVNRQFGTNYTFDDMHDPAKNLEAMIYLMRFQYERYGKDIGKALTAYNVGNCESGVVNSYAQTILSRAA